MQVREGRRLSGPAGEAIEVITEGEPPRPDQAATLAAWFLRCPRQSPAWDCYLLSVIHLRPIPGVRPAVVRRASATHELILLALSPDVSPSPLDPETWRFLTPVNVAEQVIVRDDDAARELAWLSVRAVVEGRLWAEPPLSGQTQPWAGVLAATAAHLRGEHG